MTTTRKATTVSSMVKGGSPATSRRQQTAAMGSARSAFVQSANLSKRVSRSGRKATKIAARAEVGDTLEEFLEKSTDDIKLRQLMLSMGEAVRTIAYKVRTASCSATACINSFGDEQLAVDLLADKILFETLKFSGFGTWLGNMPSGSRNCEPAISAPRGSKTSLAKNPPAPFPASTTIFNPFKGSSPAPTPDTIWSLRNPA